jgi:hypothetical protein
MSDREWRFYLDDMIRFAENVLAYCDGLNQTARFLSISTNIFFSFLCSNGRSCLTAMEMENNVKNHRQGQVGLWQ